MIEYSKHSIKLNCDEFTKLFNTPWCNYDVDEYPLIKNSLEYKYHLGKFKDNLKDILL